MSSKSVTPAELDAYLDLGIRNRWHPIAPSWMVREHPVALTRLGDQLVVWRDRDGVAHTVEDRCPHRGARLSHGWNLGDRIACWYHGVEVDASGTVVNVPASETCALVGRQAIKAYPTIEVKGAIFAYFGDALHIEPVPLHLPDELTGDDYDAILCTAKWHCNYRYALDNVMDPMHGTYLHAQSHSMSEGQLTAKMAIRDTQHGFVFEKKDQQGVNFDWTEFADTGALWGRLEIPYQKRAGPGGTFGIIGFVTPIDAERCRVFFWRTRKVQGWQRDVWRFMYKNLLEELHWEVLEQDRIVLEDISENARDREFLYEHDLGMQRLRRVMRAAAKAQLEALAKAPAARDAAE